MSGSPSVDRDLIAGWVKARSVARSLPVPVADHGGWRVDTRSDIEWCRYIFAALDPAITALARSIAQPRVFVKVCAEAPELRRILPERWQVLETNWVMTGSDLPVVFEVPAGCTAKVETRSGAIHVSVIAPDTTLAASGYAAETAGVFAYDRIVTRPDHRRRGLGRAVMGLLQSQRTSDTSRDVLVATDQGRALYTSLGWCMRGSYTTAVIPDPTP